ncbi:hypothetical protein QN277_025311 [Acacia crassicarpa]|uniref:Calcineurin-like phosphoesterase domain-containing protein n=1 Tax=Acacia crassicarpa TaxID=499986 RepID=A0AAE1JE16_9FABA|nr:hypothetical protein QN277_025311 [Acacia crassicarpa]
MEEASLSSLCTDVPNLLSSFIDTFVDFSVSGLFLLPPAPIENPTITSASEPSSPLSRSLPALQTRLPSPDRLIAIGDLHGDLEKCKQAFQLARLIDESDHWIGGSATVVQLGDVLDKGGEELKILYFLEKLKREAARSGGTIITMNGNHEIMNVDGIFWSVTRPGLDEFKVWGDWFCLGNKMKSLCRGLEKPKDPFEGIPSVFRGVKEEFFDSFKARIAALRPNGPISSRFLSQNMTLLIIGESIFVHAALFPQHVTHGLERINEEMRDWINGLSGRRSPTYCHGTDGLVWSRKFSDQLAKNCDCSTLEHVLSTIPGAKRMIMGHTIQDAGINGVCDNRAIRIDVGMSKGCINGLPEVLEIDGKRSRLRILTSNPLYQNNNSSRLGLEKEGLRFLLPENRSKQLEVKAE